MTDNAETIEQWSLRPYLSESLRATVAASDILFVPTEGYVDRPNLLFFPSGTTDFFDFVQRGLAPGTSVEVCIDDADYCEVGRHADELYIAAVIVKLLAAPLFVSLLAEYIKRKVGKKATETTLKTSITFQDHQTGKAVRLDYDGPAEAFERTALATIRQIEGGGPAELSTSNGSTRERSQLPSATPSPRRKKRRK